MAFCSINEQLMFLNTLNPNPSSLKLNYQTNHGETFDGSHHATDFCIGLLGKPSSVGSSGLILMWQIMFLSIIWKNLSQLDTYLWASPFPAITLLDFRAIGNPISSQLEILLGSYCFMKHWAFPSTKDCPATGTA